MPKLIGLKKEADKRMSKMLELHEPLVRRSERFILLFKLLLLLMYLLIGLKVLPFHV